MKLIYMGKWKFKGLIHYVNVNMEKGKYMRKGELYVKRGKWAKYECFFNEPFDFSYMHNYLGKIYLCGFFKVKVNFTW